MSRQSATLSVLVTAYLANLAHSAPESAQIHSRAVHDYGFIGCGNPWTSITDFRKVPSFRAEPAVPELCGAVCDDELYVATFKGECYCAETLTVDVDTEYSECPKNVPAIYKDLAQDSNAEKTMSRVMKRQTTNKNTIDFGSSQENTGSTNKNTINFGGGTGSTNKNTITFPGKAGDNDDTNDNTRPATAQQLIGQGEPEGDPNDPDAAAPDNSGPEDVNTPGDSNKTSEAEPSVFVDNTPDSSLENTDQPSENPDDTNNPPNTSDSDTGVPDDTNTTPEEDPEVIVSSPPDSEESTGDTPGSDDTTPEDDGSFTTTSQPEPVDDTTTPDDAAPDSSTSDSGGPDDGVDGGGNGDSGSGDGTPDDGGNGDGGPDDGGNGDGGGGDGDGAENSPTPEGQFTTLSQPEPVSEPADSSDNTPDGAGADTIPDVEFTTTSQPDPANDPGASDDNVPAGADDSVPDGANDTAEPEVQYITTTEPEPVNDPNVSDGNVPDSGGSQLNEPDVDNEAPEADVDAPPGQAGAGNEPAVLDNGDPGSVVPADASTDGNGGSADGSTPGTAGGQTEVVPGSGEPAILYETNDAGEPVPAAAPASPDAASQGMNPGEGDAPECGCSHANTTAPANVVHHEPSDVVPPKKPAGDNNEALPPVSTLVPQPQPPAPDAEPSPGQNKPEQPVQAAFASQMFQPMPVAIIAVGWTCAQLFL